MKTLTFVNLFSYELFKIDEIINSNNFDPQYNKSSIESSIHRLKPNEAAVQSHKVLPAKIKGEMNNEVKFMLNSDSKKVLGSDFYILVKLLRRDQCMSDIGNLLKSVFLSCQYTEEGLAE